MILWHFPTLEGITLKKSRINAVFLYNNMSFDTNDNKIPIYAQGYSNLPPLPIAVSSRPA